MFPRLATLSRGALCASRARVTQSSRKMSGPAHRSDVQVCEDTLTSMNHMPVPAGSWQEAHSARISKWNMMLGAQVAIFIATCYGIYATGAGYYNPHPDVKKMDLDAQAINPMMKK